MERFEFRVDSEEKNKIKKMASNLGVSVSEYVRQMSLNGFAVQYRTDVLHDLVIAVNKIGTNINQIAKVCNEARAVLSEDVKQLQYEHSQLFALLRNALVLDEDRAKIIELIRGDGGKAEN